MRALTDFEISTVAGGDNTVDEVYVVAGGGHFTWQIDVQPVGLGPSLNPFLSPVADGESGRTPWDLVNDAINAVFGDYFAVSERNDADRFNANKIDHQQTQTHTWEFKVAGETIEVKLEALFESDGTFWYDLDRNGKPETHVKAFPGGAYYYDSNLKDGIDKYDTEITQRTFVITRANTPV